MIYALTHSKVTQLGLLMTLFCCGLNSVQAQASTFKDGPLITGYGMHAAVDGTEKIASDSSFKISFDIAQQAAWGEVNRGFDSAARFLNMHVAAGVDPSQIELVMVIHGRAVKDVVLSSGYQSMPENAQQKTNINAELIQLLQRHGVQFKVCGQSATFYGIKTKDLLPGVQMSLSAMTAHAQLQQQGFSLNPF